MVQPEPYVGADDATLVQGCLQHDASAWAQLRTRHGALVTATVAGVLDGPGADLIDLDSTLDLVWDHLGTDGAAPLRRWSGEKSQLRSYLALLGRRVAAMSSEPRTLPSALLSSMPTPSGLFLDDLLAVEPAARLEAAIDRLPPTIAALVRLRLRGLSRDDIAATLGMSQATVSSNLSRIAERLGERDEAEVDTTPCWRTLLDAADEPERVALAVKSEDDRAFRAVRTLVDKTWAAVGVRALGRLVRRTAECLDDLSVAGFVDGTMRGAARARAESHVGACPRCIDEAAALVVDLRAQMALRDAATLDDTVAVAAALVATTRFAAAERLTRRAVDRGVVDSVLSSVQRLAQAGRHLDGGRPEPHAQKAREQASQVVATHIPVGEQAPLIAFEALVLGDPHAAWRAIDGPEGQQHLGARLRLLAAAAGRDPEHAQELAARVLSDPRANPGELADARAAIALPPGRSLPREILHVRLRALLPEAIRYVLTRPRA